MGGGVWVGVCGWGFSALDRLDGHTNVLEGEAIFVDRSDKAGQGCLKAFAGRRAGCGVSAGGCGRGGVHPSIARRMAESRASVVVLRWSCIDTLRGMREGEEMWSGLMSLTMVWSRTS